MIKLIGIAAAIILISFTPIVETEEELLLSEYRCSAILISWPQHTNISSIRHKCVEQSNASPNKQLHLLSLLVKLQPKKNNKYLFHLLDGPLCPIHISAKVNPIHLETYWMLDKANDLIKCQIKKVNSDQDVNCLCIMQNKKVPPITKFSCTTTACFTTSGLFARA